jgi:5'-deoxynucleotidase YfbR-like HD superfamily hydrolase
MHPATSGGITGSDYVGQKPIWTDRRSVFAVRQSTDELSRQVASRPMQPVDPEDQRRPNVQIAASIRAAILTGELEPGARLPSGNELAEFFGASRVTVLSAIRTLREEGFVRSRSGSGVYVRDQATLPVPGGTDHPLAGLAAYLHEMGHLKNVDRDGWLLLGVPQPESVAEHSFRVAVIGMALATMQSADPGRTTMLCLLHDAHETRIGDISAVGRAYITSATPEAIAAHQTAATPSAVSGAVQDLVAEFNAATTLEAQVARDADKIETLLQAIEYQSRGYDTAAWRENAVARLRTDAGRQLAQAINSSGAHQWWAAFDRSYAELRASAQGRARSQHDGASSVTPAEGAGG